MLEVNKMLNSYNNSVVDIGLFLYRRSNGENGLSPDDTYWLIKVIYDAINEEYNRGFSDAMDEL